MSNEEVSVEAIERLVFAFFNGDVLRAHAWMNAKNPHLGDVSPKQMIVMGRGKKLLAWVKAQLAENEASRG